MRSLQRNWLADLHGLDCPVTFIHGAQDTISPPEDIQALSGGMADATFLQIENAGHFVLSQHFGAVVAHAAICRQPQPEWPELSA